MKIRKSKIAGRAQHPVVLRDAGFTLLEMLVIIFILVIITSLSLTFSRRGAINMTLNSEKLKLLNNLYFVKNQAQGAFSEKEGEFPCAYGIKFYPTQNRYIIFKDLSSDCETSDYQYSGSDEFMEEYKIDPKISIKSVSFDTLVFIPPQSKVKIFPDQEQGVIVLETLDKKTETSLKVNKAGQITP